MNVFKSVRSFAWADVLEVLTHVHVYTCWRKHGAFLSPVYKICSPVLHYRRGFKMPHIVTGKWAELWWASLKVLENVYSSLHVVFVSWPCAPLGWSSQGLPRAYSAGSERCQPPSAAECSQSGKRISRDAIWQKSAIVCSNLPVTTIALCLKHTLCSTWTVFALHSY